MNPKVFYLFARRAGANGRTTEAVFYKTAGQNVADGLCGLFQKEYGDADGGTEFRCAAADSIPSQEQVLLDESLGCLEMYDDPDPGVYEAKPDRETLALAQYGVRARAWEELLREKLAETREWARRKTGGEEGVGSIFGGYLHDLPEEERRNAALALLILVTKGYYLMLESVIPAATRCPPLDMEMNESYLLLVDTIQRLMQQRELADFQVEFKPAFANLYPGSIRGAEWSNRVGRDAEMFLSNVQEFVVANGVRDPEDGSPGEQFLRYFRLAVQRAVERANAYRKRMHEFWQECLDAAGGSWVAGEKGDETGELRPPAPAAAADRAAAGGGGSGGAVITINGKKERIYHISLFPLVITMGTDSIEIKLKWETAEPEGFDLREKVRALAKRFEAGGVNLTGLKQHPDRKERGIGPELAACLEGQLEFADGHKMRVFCRTRPHTPEEEGVVFQEKMRGAGQRGATEAPLTARKAGTGEFVRGRLRCSADFKDVWLGGKHYDLRTRPKAGLCIRYLFEGNAFDATSAKHLVNEINPVVRERGGYEPLKFEEVKIQHYFNDPKKGLPELCKQLIGAVPRKGRYFLKVE